MRQYRSREGEATATDTKSALTTLGSETAPGALLVPSGVSKLSGVIVAMVGNFALAATSGGLIRIEGSGLPQGPEVIAVGATGTSVATGVNDNVPARLIELDVPVTPLNEILLFGEMVGDDIGQLSFGVTLIFE